MVVLVEGGGDGLEDSEVGQNGQVEDEPERSEVVLAVATVGAV